MMNLFTVYGFKGSMMHIRLKGQQESRKYQSLATIMSKVLTIYEKSSWFQ